MSTLQQYVHVIGGFQGCMLFLLLMLDSRVSGTSRLLGVWCLFLALVFLGPFITMNGTLNVFSWWIGWSEFLPASYGALLYLYCRNSLLGRKIELSDWVHFLPITLCYLLNLDLLFAPAEQKLNYMIASPPLGVRLALSSHILFAQAFFYSALTAAMIRRYQRQAAHTLSSFNPSVFSWLWVLTILSLVIWSLKALWHYVHLSYLIAIASNILIVVFIYCIAMAQWRNPRLFYIDQLDESKSSQDSLGREASDDSSGALTPETRQQLLEMVKQQVEHRALYRDSRLTLSALADATDISTHHLSEVLNQQEGKNFYQFINAYRVAYVCEQLSLQRKQKVLDIALQAGFSSKSTFNAIFKQITGTTPTLFREQLENSELENL
jgi:AraC-like DNA-binding protein